MVWRGGVARAGSDCARSWGEGGGRMRYAERSAAGALRAGDYAKRSLILVLTDGSASGRHDMELCESRMQQGDKGVHLGRWRTRPREAGVAVLVVGWWHGGCVCGARAGALARMWARDTRHPLSRSYLCANGELQCGVRDEQWAGLQGRGREGEGGKMRRSPCESWRRVPARDDIHIEMCTHSAPCGVCWRLFSFGCVAAPDCR